MADTLNQSRQPATAMPVFPGKYISIASYRRDGTTVMTPVWFVERDGKILVETDGASGKVKRIRRNSSVQVASCNPRGRLRGHLVPGLAEVLPESEVSTIEPLLKRKYRADMMIIGPIRLLQSTLHLGRPRTTPVILAIRPR
jgi:PPOX class probable F420-dependent enzyme